MCAFLCLHSYLDVEIEDLMQGVNLKMIVKELMKRGEADNDMELMMVKHFSFPQPPATVLAVRDALSSLV